MHVTGSVCRIYSVQLTSPIQVRGFMHGRGSVYDRGYVLGWFKKNTFSLKVKIFRQTLVLTVAPTNPFCSMGKPSSDNT